MTIEQKARAYDEAIKKASAAYGDEDRHLKATLERIFPELKESEDEKIRKWLIAQLELKSDVNNPHDLELMILKSLAWLEKQGEPTEINPSEFESQLNRLLKQFESLPKEDIASSLSFYLNVVQNDGIYKEEKRGEQKITEWHREDEQNLNTCLGYIPDEFLRRWLTDIIHIKYDKPADNMNN